MNSKNEVFYAATQILAATVTGAKGNGLHKSPELVSEAVDLAEQLAAEFDKREAARLTERVTPQAEPATLVDGLVTKP